MSHPSQSTERFLTMASDTMTRSSGPPFPSLLTMKVTQIDAGTLVKNNKMLYSVILLFQGLFCTYNAGYEWGMDEQPGSELYMYLQRQIRLPVSQLHNNQSWSMMGSTAGSIREV